MTREIHIEGRPIGPGHEVYVIAEMSANHGGDYSRAEAIVRAAKEAGADAVKLQTYTADTLTFDSDREEFRVGAGSLWQGRTLHDLYAEAQTPWEWHAPLQALARELGLHFFSSPFDETAVELLESLDVGAYKIASFEIVDLPLIRRVAATRKPMIVSTGMATLGEIVEAVDAATAAGAREIALLQCTSAYPAPPESMHLATIPHLAATFGRPVGLSDHTLDVAVPAAAVALGASIVEKHLTLSRDEPGPDSAFSLEPDEFRRMVEAVRTCRRALGRVSYGVEEHEAPNRTFRRSLWVVRDVEPGETLDRSCVRSIRPAHGLAPKYLDLVLGRRAAVAIEAGTPLSWELIDFREPA